MHRWLFCLVAALMLAPAAQGQLRFMDWLDGADRDHELLVDCENLPPTHELVVSLRSPVPFASVTRVDAFIDFCTDPEDLFEWWRFDIPGSCREDALSVGWDFPDGLSGVNPWAGAPGISVTFLPEFAGKPFLARIMVSLYGNAGDFQEDTLYNLFRVIIENPETGCHGCSEPACFILNGLSFAHAGGTEYTSMNWANYVPYNYGNWGCPFIVPVQEMSWGGIKALYH